jgi:hypothetical protein
MVPFARMTKIAALCLFLFMGFASPALAHHRDNDPPVHPPVPEIDPGSAMSAITLLGGGVLLLANKRWKKT